MELTIQEKIKELFKKEERKLYYLFNYKYSNDNKDIFINVKHNFGLDNHLNSHLFLLALRNSETSFHNILNRNLQLVFEDISHNTDTYKKFNFQTEMGKEDYISISIENFDITKVDKAIEFINNFVSFINTNITSFPSYYFHILQDPLKINEDFLETNKIYNLNDLYLYLFNKNIYLLIESHSKKIFKSLEEKINI